MLRLHGRALQQQLQPETRGEETRTCRCHFAAFELFTASGTPELDFDSECLSVQATVFLVWFFIFGYAAFLNMALLWLWPLNQYHI